MKCVSQCNQGILKTFYNYGHKVGKYPIPFMVVCVVICGALAAGLARLDSLTDMETLYTPMNSEAEKDRDVLWKTFPDLTGSQYDAFGLPKDIPRASLIFRSRQGENILENDTLLEIKMFLDQIKTINVTLHGDTYTYDDLCARRDGHCVLSGGFVLTPTFRNLLDAGKMSFPASPSFPGVDISRTIGKVSLAVGNGTYLPVLESGGSLLFSYPMRTDGHEYESRKWSLEFIDFMKEVMSNHRLDVDIAYSTAESLNIELDKSTSGDIIFFVMTLALMISYSSLVSAGGNMVSTRAFLSMGGVLATCLGIVASFGLVTLCGVQYVNMVGIMPFLLLGVGVDDMFLLMSAWSETTDHPEFTVPQRIGIVFKKAGIGITITSLTNFLSFAIGATSVFQSVRNFCIYTGAGVIMCYIANITFFGGCLSLHGKRIYSSRHTLTCRKVKSRDELQEEGRGFWYSLFCGGSTPQKAMEDQSVCERGPIIALPRFLLLNPVRIVVVLIFMANLGVAIWGCTILKEGLNLNDLVLSSSYVHAFESWNKKDFGIKLPISFVKTGHLDYRDPNTFIEIDSLIQKAQEDEWISNQIDVCWLKTYRQTPFFNDTDDAVFMAGLLKFLAIVPKFQNDVVIKHGEIEASRCHVYSNILSNTQDEADLMVRMRDLADDSPVADFAYHFAFIFFEQFILILWTTMQTVGITIAVMILVTAFFLPHPVIVLMVMAQVLMIVTCIFGYMAIWDLTLSSITMVHLIMSAGLSVDFCAHVCTAYMVSEKGTREERATDAIVHASGPILNGGMSSLVGILGLLFSESFIFQAFFKVMFLVIIFGVAHAVFFVPVLLSFVGPRNFVESKDSNRRFSPQATPEDGNLDNNSNTKRSSLQTNVHNVENGIEMDNIDKEHKDGGCNVNNGFINYDEQNSLSDSNNVNGASVKANEIDQNQSDSAAPSHSIQNNGKEQHHQHQHTNGGFTGDMGKPEENGAIDKENIHDLEQEDEGANEKLDNGVLSCKL